MNISIENIQAKIASGIEESLANLPNIAFAVLIIIVAWLAAKGIRKGVTEAIHRVNPESTGAPIVARLIGNFVFLFGLLIAATRVIPGFEFGTLIGTLGLGSVAIGFAFKELLENFIAGLYLLVAQPFKIGDVIEIGDVKGTVVDIGTRAAKIQEFNREVVIMPCARLFKEEVHVITKLPVRRLEVEVGVAYGTNLDQAQEIILNAITKNEAVAEDPAPVVACDSFGDSSINFKTYFFSDLSLHDARLVKSDVIKNINSAFNDSKITIPYPTRTILSDGDPNLS